MNKQERRLLMTVAGVVRAGCYGAWHGINAIGGQHREDFEAIDGAMRSFADYQPETGGIIGKPGVIDALATVALFALLGDEHTSIPDTVRFAPMGEAATGRDDQWTAAYYIAPDTIGMAEWIAMVTVAAKALRSIVAVARPDWRDRCVELELPKGIPAARAKLGGVAVRVCVSPDQPCPIEGIGRSGCYYDLSDDAMHFGPVSLVLRLDVRCHDLG